MRMKKSTFRLNSRAADDDFLRSPRDMLRGSAKSPSRRTRFPHWYFPRRRAQVGRGKQSICARKRRRRAPLSIDISVVFFYSLSRYCYRKHSTLEILAVIISKARFCVLSCSLYRLRVTTSARCRRAISDANRAVTSSSPSRRPFEMR